MIRRHGALLRLCLGLVDVGASLILIALISAIRFGPNLTESWGGVFAVAWAPAALITLGWIIVLWTQGLYRLRVRWEFSAQAVAMARALAVMVLLTFAALFLFKLPEVSRLFLILLLPTMAVASLLLRAVIHAYLSGLRREGRNARYVLVVGSGPSAVRFVEELESRPTLGLKVIGYLNGDNEEPSVGAPFLGTYERLGDIFHSRVVDEVAVCLDFAEWELINNVVELSRAEGKTLRVPIAGAFLTGSSAYVENLAGMPVLSLLDGPDRQVPLAVKRLLDIAGAALGLTLGSPIFVAVAVAIVVRSGRPVFFRQERVGLHGRRFQLLKFRTMVRDAEGRVEELATKNEIKGRAFKVTDDPRVTTIGRFLRRTSVDELPQLWNVLRGEMSIVGPRPPLPSEVNEYDVWHRRRLSMKPGMTGLWQVAARREVEFDRWVEMDLEYIDRWSLWLDAKIALRTLPAILRSEGR